MPVAGGMSDPGARSPHRGAGRMVANESLAVGALAHVRQVDKFGGAPGAAALEPESVLMVGDKDKMNKYPLSTATWYKKRRI